MPLVYNIQRFSLHDGPGIRTTVFFKGCPLRCRWCHNPEGLRFEADTRTDADGSAHAVGRAYGEAELLREVEKDRIFYDESGGGVTLSGGEAMAQDIDFVQGFARACGRRGLTVAVDTCGHAPRAAFERMLPHADLFLYDIKMLDAALHERYTGVTNGLILDNLAYLARREARIWLRLPLLSGINDAPERMRAIIDWLARHRVRIEQVNLLPYHEYGGHKYDELRYPRPDASFAPPDEPHMARLARLWASHGFRAVIGGGAWNEEEG